MVGIWSNGLTRLGHRILKKLKDFRLLKRRNMQKHSATDLKRIAPLSPLYKNKMNKDTALDLLTDCFADEIAHLRLRLIRDAQAPRFEALKETHPEIYRDFMAARTGPHESLLRNRRKRVQ